MSSYFDGAASTWDGEPRRVALAKAVGEAIQQCARPTKAMDMLEYGAGTGLVSLYLLPHVRSVVSADNSPGMLEILQNKLTHGRLEHIKVMLLDLEKQPVPPERYDLIVTSMAMHHVAETDKVLRAFHALLRPGGVVCIADLDTEPGLFHDDEVAKGVHHRGFERAKLKQQLGETGFHDMVDVTAHTIHKPVERGQERAFPIFLITARR